MKKEALVLLGILTLAALLLRVGHVAAAFLHKPLRADAGEYTQYARNLHEHGVFSMEVSPEPRPDSFRSPGYPLFLAGAMAVGGTGGPRVDRQGWYDLARYVQALLGAAMVPLAFLLGLAFLPVWAALAGAALTAFSPHLVTAPAHLLTETLFGFLLLTGVLLLTRGLARQRIGLIAMAGLASGLAYLVNESALPACVGLAGTVLVWHEKGKRALAAAAFLALFLIFPVGLELRNAGLADDVPQGGARALITLTHGTYPGFVHEGGESKYFPYRDDPAQPEYGASWKTFRRVFWERVRERPLRYASWYLLEKPYHLWGFAYLQGFEEIHVYPTKDSPYQKYAPLDLTRRAMRLLHPVLVVLALLALPLWWCLRRKFPLAATPALCLATLLVFTTLGVVFAPWPRYVVPLRPLLYLAALWPVAMLVSRVATRSSRLAG